MSGLNRATRLSRPFLPTKPRLNLEELTDDLKGVSRQLNGHLWTLVPYGSAYLSTLPSMGGAEYVHGVDDPDKGWVPIYGRLYPGRTDGTRLVILLHGLASKPTDPYLRQMIRALRRTGCAVLSAALRGSLGRGPDHYHAGLTDDLKAIFSDAKLDMYEEIFIVGYSLGGQIALRYAIDEPTSRLKGAVALCAPILMRPCQLALDSMSLTPYRISILSVLKWTYHRLAWNARRSGYAMDCPLRRVRQIRSFYEWDQHVVCPRYGYGSVDAYYEAVSVAPQLHALSLPSLLVFAENDPIVPIDAIRPSLAHVPDHVTVKIAQPGGHLGFSPTLDLGQDASLGLTNQVAGWIQSIP